MMAFAPGVESPGQEGCISVRAVQCSTFAFNMLPAVAAAW